MIKGSRLAEGEKAQSIRDFRHNEATDQCLKRSGQFLELQKNEAG